MTPKDIQAIVAQIQAEDDAIRELLETDPNAAYTRANANLKRAKQTGNDEQIMYCAFTLGLTALEHRPYPKLNEVLDAYKLASKKALAIGNNQSYGGSQNNLGEVYRMLPSGDREENLKNAIDCYQNALRIRTEKDFPQYYATAQNNLGLAYAYLSSGDRGDNLKIAVECFQNALRIRTEKDFPQEYATIQNHLGNAYANLPSGDRGDNLKIAIACYQNALRIYTEKDFPQEYADTQNNLGSAYADLPTGDKEENLKIAIVCFQNALRIYTEKDFPQEYATIQNHLGSAYADLPTGDRGENLKNAIVCFQNALRIYTEKDFPQEYAATQRRLGLVYAHLPTGDRGANLKNAIACYRNALRIRTEKDFQQNYAATQNNLGLAYTDLPTGDRGENLKNAIACYRNALEFYTEKDFPDNCLDTLYNLTLAYEAFDDKQNAYKTCAKAIDVLENRIRPSLRSVESLIALSKKWAKLYNLMVSLCISFGKIAEAIQYKDLGKSRIFVEMLYSGKEIKPFSVSDIMDFNKSIFIEFITRDKFTYISVLDRKSNNIVKIAVDIGLENWITSYNQYKEKTITQEEWFQMFENTLKLLAEKFWYAEDENGKSLDSLVKQSGLQHIVFIPQIELHVLPLHLIPIQSGERLFDKYEISYTFSLQSLVYILERSKKSSDKLFAVANPDRSLEFADNEVEGILKYFKQPHVLKYEDAKITAVLKHAKEGNILHFACHGKFDLENPFESELSLAEEKLTLREIFAKLRLPKTDFATLSACETGINKIEPGGEYIGLSAGFLYAGANSVISSLWAVDDLSTSLLMEKFYDNMLNKKMGKAKALKQAQQYVRDISNKEFKLLIKKLVEDIERQRSSQRDSDGRDYLEKRGDRLFDEQIKYEEKPDDDKPFEHPYYWGAFVCNGKWD